MNITGVSNRRSVLDRLTVPGSFATSVGSRQRGMDQDLQDAVASVSAGIYPPNTISPRTNPYVQQMGTNVYQSAPGFGDDGFGNAFPQLYPALNDGLSDSNWADVAKTFADEIGKGIGGKISGKNPWQATPAPTPIAAVAKSSMLTYALVGGAAVLGTFLLFKVLR